MAFLLDTNAWIVYLKLAESPIRSRLEKLTPSDVLFCSVVKAELLHGAQKYGNRERRLRLLAETFAPYASLPFDDAAAVAYANIRHQLETTGNIAGPNDLMIASIAQANSLILVTHNTAEFGRIPSLQIEDWQT
jgi:tRNA(fMet)-specific endonuclease VapC